MELDSHCCSRQHGSMTDQIVRLRINLEDIEPIIWRRIELPLANSLKTLHLAIQAAMLFENYHMFRFDVGDASYGIPMKDDWMDPPTRDAGNIRLAKLVERGITSFCYIYDFGDNWRHHVEIEGVFAADPEREYPRFVDGERRAPPEDVGGFPGFEEFLDAMTKPRHPNRKAMLEWYGRPFEPLDISADNINARMAKLAKRRAFGKAAHQHAKSVRHQ
jgi:hypothetical protein